MRTAILLGAGASVDAGFLVTDQLARALVKAMNATRRGLPETALLNFVYGAMVNAKTSRGGDPLAAVNIETMFSAIRLLRDRHSHEAAPFVQAWVSSVDALDGEAGPRFTYGRADEFEKGVADAIGASRYGRQSGDRLLKAVRDVVRDEIGSVATGARYSKLERELRRMLVNILGQPVRLDYLSPILDLAESQPGGLDIVTLNYDLTIELAAAARQIPVVRGIEAWQAGTGFKFDPIDRTINLVKPHGSIDWTLEKDDVPGGLPQSVTKLNHPTDLIKDPAVVIGQREKLATEGSTLGLMRAFDDVLHRADRLVIVGYSGGDAHVNAVIRDWVNADLTRTIVVLDPSWPRLGGHDDRGFRTELNRHLGAPTARGGTRRLAVIRASAADGLPDALTTELQPDPDPWFELKANVTDDTITIEVTNLGRDLKKTQFRASGIGWPSSTKPPTITRSPEADSDGSAKRTSELSVPQLSSGETISVVLRYSTAEQALDWHLHITGEREVDEITGLFNAQGQVLRPETQRRK